MATDWRGAELNKVGDRQPLLGEKRKAGTTDLGMRRRIEALDHDSRSYAGAQPEAARGSVHNITARQFSGTEKNSSDHQKKI
jgi:hypothetical protein